MAKNGKKDKSGVRAGEIATYSLGSLGREISNNCVSVFFLVYLNVYMGLDVMVLTVAFVLAKLWDAVNDPMLATLVNNTKRGRFGRFRPWMLVGALLNAASLVLMFSPVSFGSELLRYVYYIGMYVIWGMTFTVVDVLVDDSDLRKYNRRPQQSLVHEQADRRLRRLCDVLDRNFSHSPQNFRDKGRNVGISCPRNNRGKYDAVLRYGHCYMQP